MLTEPQIYKCDVEQSMRYLRGLYEYHLNSYDVYDPELPIIQAKAHGGTMVLWKKELDPYITTLPALTPVISSFLFHPPLYEPTIHVCI